jgi:Xaa-Pro aminopeptidase
MLFNRDRAIRVMDELGVDALVATTPENVYYLSGYGSEHSFHFAPWGLSCAVFARDGAIPPTLIIQEWEIPQIADGQTWMENITVQTGVEARVAPEARLGPVEARVAAMWENGRSTGLPNRQRLLGRTLLDLGLGRSQLAIDDSRVLNELEAHELSSAECLDGVNVFREIRLVKTEEEIALLSEAARMNQVALESVATLIHAGTTCGELLRRYRGTMGALGGYGSHMTGGGSSHPWITNPDFYYRLKMGDVIQIDPAGHYKHYWTDLGRTAVVGEPSPLFVRRHAALQEVHRVVVPLMQDGGSTAELKAKAREVAATEMTDGFLAYFHAIGIEQYDHPQSLGEFLTEDFPLIEGMTVNFETLYWELGWGMMQLEDTYLVSAGGPKRLATLSRDWLRSDAGSWNGVNG